MHTKSMACIAAGLFAAAVMAQTGSPTAAFVLPNTANAGESGVVLTVTGSNFSLGSVVYFNTQALPTTVLGISQLRAAVSASLLATPGQFPVFVVNPGGTRSNNLTFTVLAPALSITTTSLPAGQEGVPYSQQLAVSGGTAPYVWDVSSGLPPGLSLSQSGLLSGVPSARGSYSVGVRVTDAAQRSATLVLPLTIAAPAISISTAAALPPAVEGTQYSQALSAQSSAPPLRWSVGAGLPMGITLNPSTGVLSGVPTARGNYTFEVRVTDNSNASASRVFTLTVQPPPLVIATVSPLFDGAVGSPYAQTFSATGGTPPYAWTMQPAVPGLRLDPTTGVLAGSPEQARSYTITVQVTDGAGVTTSKDFNLSVAEPALRISNANPLPQGTVDTAYQQRFLATGGRPPYLWSIASGSIPSGLTLDTQSGVLSGTPASGGLFNFVISLADSAGASTSRPYSVSIAAGALRLAAPAETLKNVIGNRFSVALSVSGGAPPYVWSANGLPEGIDIDPATGEVSGTFTRVGSFLFTIRVTDAQRTVATELVRVDVSAPPLPALTAMEVADVLKPADQTSIRLQLSQAYSLPLTGQLLLTFAPESGGGDASIQFSQGGRTAEFEIPAGSTSAQFAAGNLGLQTGTVAGAITLTARLQSQGAALTPTPLMVKTVRIERSAPSIVSARFSRSGSGIEVRLTGYSTPREVTQAVFRFRAAGGSTLSASEVTLPVEDLFSRWFRDAASSEYGSQFAFSQQFQIQGDAGAVTPVSVTLTNRSGSTTVDIQP